MLTKDVVHKYFMCLWGLKSKCTALTACNCHKF